jgi:signal transduction histidine kinase
MPWWPALARRAWRSKPILADIALAIVLAAFSLLTLETQRQGRVDQSLDTEVSIQPTPVTPGDPVEITVRKGGKPFSTPNVEPLLTIQNVTTGKWKTYVAKPTAEAGVYRVPAVHPGKGVYSYTVLYGPFEQNVTIRAPNQPATPPADPLAASSGSDSPSLWAVALTLLATLPIALRRRFPLLVFAVTLTAALVMDVRYNSFQFAGAVAALYTVAAYVGRPGSIGIGVGAALALPITRFDDDPTGLPEIVSIYVIFAVAWVIGDRIGARRTYLRELEERAVTHERERDEHARRAAAEEQARIARELHDIIAHNVSVMTVQAAAAGDAFETQPSRAREALASIESTGREALAELRRLLGSVRQGDGPGAFAPQPGLARLDDLIEQVRATGLTVELTVEGSPRELPPSVDLSAYRIVQEALTNTLKHADASHAIVLVRYGTLALDVEVVDDGRGAAADGTGFGHGIIGMRERAVLFGGELRAGPASGRGFSVRARIPLEQDTA